MKKQKKKKLTKKERNRMRKEGLNFNPRVSEFTDICTRIRLSCSSLLFSNTFSLFNCWDLFFLLHLPQKEAIHDLQGRER